MKSSGCLLLAAAMDQLSSPSVNASEHTWSTILEQVLVHTRPVQKSKTSRKTTGMPQKAGGLTAFIGADVRENCDAIHSFTPSQLA